MIVFFVNDNQADIAARRENRRTRADDNIGLAAARAAPFVEAFARAKRRMQNRHALLKTALKNFDSLRRERDFRHQNQSAPPHLQTFFNGRQINLGFAAGGDAVQQEGFGCLGFGIWGLASALLRYFAKCRFNHCNGVFLLDR